MMDPIPKEQLLSKLLDGVKGCQSRFGSRTELATEDEDTIRKLCIAFEDVFLHGAKLPEKGRSLWQMTENLVPAGLRIPTEHASFWPLVKSQLSKHETERFLLLHNVRSDYGRARAWLRAALNEHSLERYILILLSLDNLSHYYETWAFLRDPELSTILPQTAAGLGSVLFALVVDNPVLDCWVRNTISKEDAVASPIEVAEVADQFLTALQKESSSLSSGGAPNTSTQNQRHSNLSKKKKKKPHVNVVSFDDDGSDKNETRNVSSNSKSQTRSGTEEQRSSTSPHSSSTSATTTPTPTPTLNQSNKRLTNSLFTSPTSTTSPVQIAASSSSTNCRKQSHFDEDLPEISIYSSSVKSVDCISVNSVYSDCSERVDLDTGDVNFGRISISPSQRLKPVRDRTSSGTATTPGGGGTGTDSDPNDADSSSQDLNLIPVPNFDHESCRRAAPELQIDLDLSSTMDNITSPSPVATPSCASEPFSNSTTTDNVGKGKKVGAGHITANMIDARISNAGGIDEERIVKLKAILDREIETVATLQAQLAEEKRKSTDTIKILEARVESLTKDNEILKHQLNKYIGAVQLLKKERSGQGGMGRRGSSFEEDDEQILSQVKTSNADEGNSTDEGAEYERKLIQVAEMHGELMEFNSHLQTSLRKRDLVIRRLREELVDLRGPLSAPLIGGPGDDTGFDDGSWDIVDSASAHSMDSSGGGLLTSLGSPASTGRRQLQLTHNERVLINIWIPSAFLTGANTDLHHVYQVFIRIKDTEWNVYRRYSQFYSLHRDLKKRDSVIGSFYFPPKKHLGNKDGKFVDERRRKLQEYLRKVINHTLQSNSILAAHPDKNLLISIFPFFGESTFIHQKKKERSRRLFFRPSGTSSSSSQVHNSPSGFQTQMQYPQYTGL